MPISRSKQAIRPGRKAPRGEIKIDDDLLAANSANAGAQRNKAVAFMQIGQAHELLASRASASTATRRSEWREARAWYQRSLDLWIEMRNKGTLIPGYAGRLDDAKRAVEKCDAALAPEA